MFSCISEVQNLACKFSEYRGFLHFDIICLHRAKNLRIRMFSITWTWRAFADRKGCRNIDRTGQRGCQKPKRHCCLLRLDHFGQDGSTAKFLCSSKNSLVLQDNLSNSISSWCSVCAASACASCLVLLDLVGFCSWDQAGNLQQLALLTIGQSVVRCLKKNMPNR